MKGKLTKITGIYTLLDDNDRMVASDDVDMQKDYQIGKLSTKNCNGIFGLYDVEELADFYSTMTVFFKKGEVPTHKEIEDAEYISEISFKAGFNKAMELNKDKRFTLDDMHKMFYLGSLLQTDLKSGKLEYKPKGEVFNDYIQPLQQPKEIEVEIKMEPCFYDDSLGGFSTSYTEDKPKEQPKLDSDGCLILKKV